MKNKLPYMVIVILIILLWFKSCGGESQTTTVTIPAVKGTIVKTEIKHDTIYKENKVVKRIVEVDPRMEKEIESLVNENTSLMSDFFATKDSLKQAQLYADAIKIKTFSTPYEDEFLKGTMNGVVRGEVKALLLDYEIKERKIDVPIKEKKFALLAGVEVGNTKQLNDFSAKANVGFQNKKGNIIHVGMDTNERIYIGYTIEVFSIKR